MAQTRDQKLDSVLSYVFLTKLLKKTRDSEAFRLGLVDSEGKIIKEPTTEIELQALTLFDKLIFKIKRMLGSKLPQLNSFIYLQTLDDNFDKQINITGGSNKKSSVLRVQRDLEKLMEKHDLTYESFISELLHEETSKTIENRK